MNFESELNKGIFCIPECSKCNMVVWPPADFCSNCFGVVNFKKNDFFGTVISVHKQENDNFYLVEIKDKIKIIAKSKDILKEGQVVKMVKCGISGKNYFFWFS